MDDAWRSEIAAIAADSRSGATALVARAIAVLRSAAADRESLEAAAAELCRAQPSMAALRVAASVALQAPDPAAALDAFAARTGRAPHLIARYAAGLLTLRRRTGRMIVVTCSRSHAVEEALIALAAQVEIEVKCAESRPALEGRDLAVSLSRAGIHVTLYTDAGISSALSGAEAFLAGADAIGPDAFINKVGTGALSALAALEGVPTYVLAGREKIVSADVFASLAQRGGPEVDVWREAPPGVDIQNPYFEVIRSTGVAAFVTDAGVIAPNEIAELSMI